MTKKKNDKTTVDIAGDKDILEVIGEDDFKETKKSEKPSNHYVDNERLSPELIAYAAAFKVWKDAGKPEGERPPLPDYVAYCILETAKRSSMIKSYINYPDREGMVGEAILNMVKYIHNYDPTKGKSAFAYISEMAKRSFWRYIEDEKKQLYVKAKKIQRAGIEDQIHDTQDQDMDTEFKNTFIELIQDSTDIIDNFEARLEKKREKAREKAREKKAKAQVKGNLNKFVKDEDDK